MEIMPYIWFGIAIVAGCLEATTYQLVSIWFVLGAVVTAIVSIFIPELVWVQVVIFIAVSIISLIATRPFVKKIAKVKKQPTNSDRYIGMTGVVLKDIDNSIGAGQVNVKGSIWSAASADDSVISAGEKVKIIEIKGVKLVVSQDKE